MDVRARVPEPEIADVTILAAVWGYEKKVVQKELAQTSSSGPVNLRASAGGAIVRLHEGKHGTVLFLTWGRVLYTAGDKNVKGLAGWKVAGLKVERLTFLLDTGKAGLPFHVRERVSCSGPDHTYRRDSFPLLGAAPLGLEGSWDRSRNRPFSKNLPSNVQPNNSLK